MKILENLVGYFQHLLNPKERDEVSSELNRYPIEKLVSVAGETNIIKWWASLEKSKRYPVLTKVALATLSIFHGPVVESSFNVMGVIMDTKSASIQVDTYSAYQTVKHALKACKTAALKLFEK